MIFFYSSLFFSFFFFFFFNDTATTEIYTLSLHDALPLCSRCPWNYSEKSILWHAPLDRKSTRLNSSHVEISYAVFCLKKKKITTYTHGPIHIYDESRLEGGPEEAG